MSGVNVPCVLVPRYTSYVGGGMYPTLPMPVSAYESLVVSVWRGTLIGAAPSIAIQFEESNDLGAWEPCSGTVVIPGAGQEVQCSVAFTKAWFRMVITLNTADSGVTMWAQGFFILRER